MNSPRVVFISATALSRYFHLVPGDTLDQSIFFFGSDRRWVFPSNAAQHRMANKQPTDYSKFDPEFKQIILRKEENGLVCWLKPQKDYNAVSLFLQSINDPITGQPYNPLILDKSWWLKKYNPIISRYHVKPERVILNYQTGEHDYDSTMELLYQSNHTLVPVNYPYQLR